MIPTGSHPAESRARTARVRRVAAAGRCSCRAARAASDAKGTTSRARASDDHRGGLHLYRERASRPLPSGFLSPGGVREVFDCQGCGAYLTGRRRKWCPECAEKAERAADRSWSERKAAGYRRPVPPSRAVVCAGECGRTIERHPDTPPGTATMCRPCRRGRRESLPADGMAAPARAADLSAAFSHPQCGSGAGGIRAARAGLAGLPAARDSDPPGGLR